MIARLVDSLKSEDDAAPAGEPCGRPRVIANYLATADGWASAGRQLGGAFATLGGAKPGPAKGKG